MVVFSRLQVVLDVFVVPAFYGAERRGRVDGIDERVLKLKKLITAEDHVEGWPNYTC